MLRNITWLLVLFFAISLSFPVTAAPFGDVPEDHWAAEAVSQLAEKGLVEGYPDGLYRGDRAASRYEMAMIVSRLLAKVEQMAKHEHEQYVTKQDLVLVRKLMNEYKEELDALGVRMSNAENALAVLEKRVTELERVKVYGEFRTRFVSSGAHFNEDVNVSGAIVQATAAQFEAPRDEMEITGSQWAGNAFNGRVYTSPRNADGTFFTTSATIGVKGKLAKGVDGGAEISAWSAAGDRNNAFRFGTRMPYITNSFTENSNFSATGDLKDNAFNFRAALDNIWVQKGDWKLTLGTYRPDRTKRYFLSGAPNLQHLEPGEFYPLWGAQLKGKWVAGNIPMWGEAYFAKLPEQGGSVAGLGGDAQINTYLFGGHIDLNFNNDKGNFGVNWQRVVNTDTNYWNGIAMSTAFVNRPLGGPTALSIAGDATQIPWTTTGVPYNTGGIRVSPQNQEMDMVGVEASHKFPELDSKSFKNFYLQGKWSHSDYKPTSVIPAGATSVPGATGDMWSFLVGAKVFGVDLKGEYLTVDATYDPFIVQFPNPFGLFTGPGTGFTWPGQSPYSVAFAPSGANTAGFYSVHDTRSYPHNRQGIHIMGTWDFNLFKSKGKLYSCFESLEQKELTSAVNLAQVGFIEPHFVIAPTSTGTDTKGKLFTWHNGFRYDIILPWTKNKLTWDLYHRFRKQSRDTNTVDNIDFQQHRWVTRFSYPFSEKLSIFAAYGIEELNRANLSRTVNAKWAEQEWAMGLTYNVAKDAQWYVEGRTYNKQKYANPLTGLGLADNGVTNGLNGTWINSGFNMKF